MRMDGHGGCNMSLQVNFLHENFDYFLKNLDGSEEQRERFHKIQRRWIDTQIDGMSI